MPWIPAFSHVAPAQPDRLRRPGGGRALAAGLGLAGVLALSLACGGGAGGAGTQVATNPVISDFVPAQDTITAGTGTTLTAVFANGTGSIGGLGLVTAGSPIATGNLDADTTFMLVVAGPQGTTPAFGTAQVHVVPAPAAPAIVPADAVLAPGQTGCTASVPGQDGMTFLWTVSGGTLTAGAGTAQVTFTAGAAGTLLLTCQATNRAGASRSGAISLPVTLAAEPSIASFAPVQAIITAGTGTSLMAVFANGAGSVGGLGPVTSGIPLATGNLNADTPYSLAVTGAPGTASVSRTTTVRVVPAPVIPAITAGAATLLPGQAGCTAWVSAQSGMTFQWSIAGGTLTAGADSVQVSFTAGDAGNLVLTCRATNAAGSSGSGSLNLPVQLPALPTVGLFAADPPAVCAGQSGTLSWSVTGATSIAIDAGVGVATGNRVTVSPMATTTYTLSATNPGGTATAVVTLPVVVLPPGAKGACAPTGSMAAARSHACSIRLPDGQVLVTGGSSGLAPLASAERYDPAAGTFTAAGAMTQPRIDHSATLLPDGRVLLAGGGALASAERYDPADGSFTATSPLVINRSGHTATLLPSGLVLLAGGTGAGGALASAELLDPQQGTFRLTGAMSRARSGQTATLLPNGKVLVAGGTGGTPLASTELYDPATGRFTAGPAMATARQGHSATLLGNGLVLVAGGSGAGELAAAELYDPNAGGFSPTGPMTQPRAEHAAILLANGQVLVAGGTTAGVPQATQELYDPATGAFACTRPMGAVRAWLDLTPLPDSRVLICGGGGAQAERFDPQLPAPGVFTSTGSMAQKRQYHTATRLPDGRVLVAGGGPTGAIGAELYDPSTGTFSPTAGPMSTPRSHHTATLLGDGRVLLAGGTATATGLAPASAELFDPVTVTFTATGAQGTGAYDHTATRLGDGRVLLAGGTESGEQSNVTSLFDPATGTFSQGGYLLTERARHAAILLPDGRVLLSGGFGGNGTGNVELSSCELYDPWTGLSSVTGGLTISRSSHTATLLPNGLVLIAGKTQNSGGPDAFPFADLYDPAAGTAVAAASSSMGGESLTATLLPSGQVLIAGGQTWSGFGGFASAYWYDPEGRAFTATGRMSQDRYGHTATLLTDGRVLVTGGTAGGGTGPIPAELYQ